MATVHKSDGTTYELTGSGPDGRLTLEQMQKAVGGYIEFFHHHDHGTLVANEEGLIQKLPLNAWASDPYNEIYIVGDVIQATAHELSEDLDGIVDLENDDATTD